MAILNYYNFTPCCGGHPVILAQGSVIFPDINKVYQYTGVYWIGAGGFALETDQCYTVELILAEYVDIPDCPPIENFIETPYEECDNDDPLNVCGDCEESPQPVFSCLCSTVQNTGISERSYTYIDCVGEQQIVSVLSGEKSPKLCVREWSIGNQNAYYEFYGDCIGDKCPSLFLLTDCNVPKNTLCSNSISLQDYFYNGSTVVLNGYPGICWTIEEIEDCPNPIAVNVTSSFRGCLECLSTFQVNYLLLNCETQAVIYTSTDLFEHVGGVVSLIGHTDDCWQVIALDSGIPSDAPVEVDEVFPECIDCTSTYYLLEDCNLENPVESIVTNTDLSAYVGEVITLTTCPEICWQVSETDYVSNYQITNLETPYDNCEECLASLACKCVQFTNNESTFLRIDVILCDGKTSILDILSGETSPKLCLSFWYIEGRDVTVIDHGDCIDNECSPEPPPRRRKVRPGYNTPVCSTEYYERVVCNFSEWMYKDVLEKRYGISNCCPEELLKWQIKHEMLMLDVLVNPDYECQTSTSCCGPTLSMNYTRTCNS